MNLPQNCRNLLYFTYLLILLISSPITSPKTCNNKQKKTENLFTNEI